jgi:hypothetical protein
MWDVKEVVTVLDAEMHQEFMYANDVARVNWLRREKLFDFERVAIVQASEYEVERLCIQVGNDPEPSGSLAIAACFVPLPRSAMCRRVR